MTTEKTYILVEIIHKGPLKKTIANDLPARLARTAYDAIVARGEDCRDVKAKAVDARAIETAIRVWEINDAPQALGLPSDFFLTSGGDEDWVAEVPPKFIGSDGEPWPLWMGEGSAFGRCSVAIKDHPFNQGWKIAIGGHA